jgi:2-hydroxy-3-oxopropionate reductase
MTTLHLALLGTGRMGEPIGGRLLGAGFDLTVWNRTPDKALDLVRAGARNAATPVEAVQGADIVVLSLTDHRAVADVMFRSGAAEALAESSLVVDTSTISPAAARDHAARLADRGIGILDAPVSGGTRGAADGSLSIFVGGSEGDFLRARPVFGAMGRATHLGPSGSGQVAKCVNQLIVAVSIAAVSEALVLARAAGIDEKQLHAALLGGFADSRILREHGSRMVERAFTPGGTVRNQVKDLTAVQSVATDLGLSLPVTSLVTELFRSATAHGLGEMDHSALLLEFERRSARSPSAGTMPASQDREGEVWTSG